jgi:acyl transferase domain-containing protein
MSTSGQACTTTPIATVGMGCRFSGDATNPQKLWKLLEQGRSTWSKIPSSRFNVSGVYHPDGQRVGSVHFSFLTFTAAELEVPLFGNTFANSRKISHRLM